MKFLYHSDVIRLRRKKEACEVKLAHDLADLFWKDKLLNKSAQDQMVYLLSDMVIHHAGQKSAKTSLVATLKEESALQLWTHVPSGATVDGVEEALARMDRGEGTLDDCGDVLRLYGKFAKKAKLKDGVYRDGVDAIRKTKDKTDHPLRGAFGKIQSLKSDHKGKPKLARKVELGVKEGTLEKKRSRGESGALPHDSTANPRPMVPDHLRGVFDDPSLITSASGCNRWALRLQSESSQISKAFGLPFGGDISGTTAGAIYSLNVAARLTKKHGNKDVDLFDFLFLLPLISLVKLFNHTLLEIALAFMYCDIIDDYHIGYYRTLFPKACHHDEDNAGIVSALLAAEKNSPKFLVYTRQDLIKLHNQTQVLRGFLMEGDDEETAFKPIASTKRFYGWRGRTEEPSLTYPNDSAKVVRRLLLRNAKLSPRLLMALTMKKVTSDEREYFQKSRALRTRAVA